MKIFGILSICGLLSLLTGCAWLHPVRDGVAKPEALFAVGSTEAQVTKSMGVPGQITLKNDTEYWHYGGSWVAFLNGKVVKYENKGALRVAKLDSDGEPIGQDIPDVPPPSGPPPASSKVKTKISELEGLVNRRPPSAQPRPEPIPLTTIGTREPPVEDAARGQWVN